MDDKLITKVENALEILAEQVGQGVDHFWPLFVKQQVIEGYALIVHLSLVFTGVLILFFTAYLIRNKKDSTGDHVWPIPIVIGTVLLVIFTAISFREMTNIAGKINNPEYYAIKEVMGLVK